MAPKKIRDPTKTKRKAVRTTIELKKELITKYESGARLSHLAVQYGMAKSTISSILKNKEVIKGANVAKGVTVLAVNRSPVIEEIEKLLLIWIKEIQLAGGNVSEPLICEKAKQLHAELRRDTPGASLQRDEFMASRGWFDRFKKRSGIHSLVRHLSSLQSGDIRERLDMIR